jgi:HSP20 family protein
MFVLPLAPSALRPYRPAFRRLDSTPTLVRMLDRLLDDVAVPASAEAPVRTPALDVEETDTHYVLRFDLPGASKESLKVSVEGRRVQLETESETVKPVASPEPPITDATADTPTATERPAARSLYRERAAVRYARTVSLPQEVDSDASEARLEHGVLTLHLAKRKLDGARRLTVN